MPHNDPSPQPVLEVLREAAALHSRHRAAWFLLRALKWLAIAVPALMLADLLFQFGEVPRLGAALGWLAAVAAALLAAGCLARFVHPPVLRIARLLEERNPALGSKLVNILQLDAEARRQESAPLTRELARRAVSDAAAALDLPTLPPLAREPRLAGGVRRLVTTLAVLAALTLAGGRHARQQWLRFLDPYGDHPPFSLTSLEILQPAAGSKVLYGGDTTLEVRATGHQPRELFVTARPVDGAAPSFTLPLTARGDGTFVARLEEIRNPLELTAHTGEGGSRSHRRLLELILTPQLGPAIVRIAAPAYTGQAARDLPYRFTALQALEGSQIGFRLSSNRPLGSGSLRIDSGETAAAEVPLQPGPQGPPDTASASFTAGQSARLTFALVDVAGNPAAESPSATLTVTRDLPPAIAIGNPDQDALVVEGLTVPVVVDASDDYGLRSVRLHIGVNDRFLPLDPVAFDGPGARRHQLKYPLDLAKLGARPGDRVAIFAEAIDTRPEPQLTRTETRRLELITEEDYNDFLREQADAAMIAGKYEALLDRLLAQTEEQRGIEEKLAALREKAAAGQDGDETRRELVEALAAQEDLNRRLGQLADEMENFGRERPVYDFERDLQESVRRQAYAIRESVAQDRMENDLATGLGGPPPGPPPPKMLAAAEQAARAHRERLQGGGEQVEREVREPLADLARLHELMKDFNLFRELAERQQQLAEQSKAYQDQPQLNAEDRLALREMGTRQRDLARALEQLGRKLRQDAGAAAEEFPEAAASARELAGEIDGAAMPALARQAAQSMLDAKANDSHAQARNLHQAMDRLFRDAAQAGQQGVAAGLDRALRLQRRMNPGDSLRQMMLSRNFRPLPNEGASGTGAAGFMASAAIDAAPKLLGGESLLDGPIAQALAGRGDQGGNGLPGAPGARLDRPDRAGVDQRSARRTSTPGDATLLLDYERLADAYFRRLTTKP